MKKYTRRKQKQNKPKKTSFTDVQAIHAFVHPIMYPILLSCYQDEGKTEKQLKEDIQAAKEYLVSSTKSKGGVAQAES